ncbi:SLC13 family permease [Haloferula sp.]|uniref:SLC13 family permease n=1 Tax=Haloferula sp. TaxID=2497595 RepID=UPI00329BF761
MAQTCLGEHDGLCWNVRVVSQQKETLVREGHSPFYHPQPWGKMVVVALAFGFFFAIRSWFPVNPVPEGCTAEGIRTGLAILVLAATLWLSEALPLALTAVLIPVVASLTGSLDVTESFAGFAHPLIYLFLGGFGLAAALSRQGLDRWLANGILRFGGGHFHVTTIALFIVSAVLSMWISNTATVALLLPVALGIIASLETRCGKEAMNRVAPYLLLGIAYSASIGGIGTLIGTPPNAIAAANLKIGFVEWLKIGMPCVAILLPILFVVLRVLARPGKVPRFEVQSKRFNFDGPRLATLVIFLFAIAGWLFSGRLSQFFGIEKSFDTLVAITALLVLATCRLVDWSDIDRTTDWGVLLLFGGGIGLSKVLGVTGSSLYLAQKIQQLAEGWPLFLLVGVVVVFMVFLTELSSNTASTALLVPIFAAVAVDLGVPVTRIVLPLTLAASCAFMLPIATPPNAIVFGSGLIRQRTMIRIGLVLNLLFAAILTLLSAFFF